MNILKKLKFLPILLLPFFGIYLFYINSQNIADWWRLKNYEPTESIVSLADSSSFNSYGRKLFYVYDPSFLVKQDFAGKCEIGEETIVLGCYVSSSKIYVLDVEDERLAGVEQVTAAHEMLHAAYDRLPADEKKEIDTELAAVFSSLKDTRLIKTIEDYRARDPGIVANELHSMIGTEVSKLPESLEKYYSKYFVDRQSVVQKANAYESEFTGRENKIAEYDLQLADMKADIESQELYLQGLQQELNLEYSALLSKKANPSEYNAAADRYNANVKKYNNLINKVQKLTDSYNEIVKARNLIAVEQQELVNAIDTRLPEAQ